RLQAVLSQRHEERRPADDAGGRAAAATATAVYPVPVALSPARAPASVGRGAEPARVAARCHMHATTNNSCEQSRTTNAVARYLSQNAVGAARPSARACFDGSHSRVSHVRVT